jgi:UDP-3-O-[3-hydroxymyristoyl] glucosamine N-acyltransferase
MLGAAGAYVAPEDYSGESSKPCIKVKSTRAAFAQLINIFMPEDVPAPVISTKASIDPSSFLGADVSVGDFVVVGRGAAIGRGSRIYPNTVIGAEVRIGENCIVYPNVTIYDGCRLGDRVIIHAGAVIGGDGFGFIPGAMHTKIPHRGTVIIEDDVEIGANTSIDRGTLGATAIGAGTKIDNLCQIAHNVTIGKGCLIAAHVGISGSTVLGDSVSMGGQVGVADHVHIGSFTSFAGRTGIHHDIPEKSGSYGGALALPAALWAKQSAILAHLPELRKKVLSIEKRLKGDRDE